MFFYIDNMNLKFSFIFLVLICTVFSYSLLVFNDSSSTVSYSFAIAGENSSIGLQLPKNADISNAFFNVTAKNSDSLSQSVDISRSDEYHLGPEIVIDSNGDVFVFYGSDRPDIDSANSTNDFTTFNMVGGDSEDHSVVIDSNDVIHLVYVDSSVVNDELLYTSTNGESSVVDSDSHYNVSNPYLYVDDDDSVHVVYERIDAVSFDHSLMYAYLDKGAWTRSAIPCSNDVNEIYPSMVIDNSDDVHVFFRNASNGVGHIYDSFSEYGEFDYNATLTSLFKDAISPLVIYICDLEIVV